MRAMLHPLPGIGGSGVSGQRRAARDLERDLALHAVVHGELVTDGGDEAGERPGSGVSLARQDDDLVVPEVVLLEVGVEVAVRARARVVEIGRAPVELQSLMRI